MNKKFYLVAFLLMAISIGVAYVLFGGSEDTASPPPSPDQGIHIPTP